MHVGAQAFHVDTDDKIRCPLPGAPDPGGGEHMSDTDDYRGALLATFGSLGVF